MSRCNQRCPLLSWWPWPPVCSQWECSSSVFRPALTTISCGPSTTEEPYLWELDSVKRCPWELVGKWFQVCSCGSDHQPPLLLWQFGCWRPVVWCVYFRISGQSAGHQLVDGLGSLHQWRSGATLRRHRQKPSRRLLEEDSRTGQLFNGWDWARAGETESPPWPSQWGLWQLCPSPCLLSDSWGRAVGCDCVWRVIAAPDEGPPADV